MVFKVNKSEIIILLILRNIFIMQPDLIMVRCRHESGLPPCKICCQTVFKMIAD